MASTAGSLLTNLVTGLSSLSPGQVLLLGHHLTASNGAKALQYLGNMLAMPGNAGTYFNLLAQLTDLPSEIVTDANAALMQVGTPGYTVAILNAQAAVQRILASENAIQQATGV